MATRVQLRRPPARRKPKPNGNGHHKAPRLTAAMKKEIARQVALATPRETDDTFVLGARRMTGGDWRDRWDYKRDEILRDALLAWRDNPLARRIVGLTTQYVVGGGIQPQCKHAATNKFLNDFWEHRLNRMQTRLMEWCDEMTRSGNLFVLVSTDRSGMSYVRAVPAADIQQIDHVANDVEQPTQFHPLATTENPDPQPWAAYDAVTDGYTDDGQWPTVMLHYAVNRPVGAQWGESDLTPILRWLARYNTWLEDRVRLNRFRNTFIWDVAGTFPNPEARTARERELNANPPNPGTILVHDVSETWEAKLPRLEAQDVSADGIAIKKMLAAGAGVPMHFLAEPEGSTRTTAEASGGPTYRHYEQRQIYFLWMLRDLLTVVRRRAAAVRSGLSTRADITARGPDISARDNAALANAAAAMIDALLLLRDRQLIDDAELLRLAYYFAGEVIDVEEMLARAKTAPPSARVEPADGSTDRSPVEAQPPAPDEETALTTAHTALTQVPSVPPVPSTEEKHFTIVLNPPAPQYIPPPVVIVNPLPPEVVVQASPVLVPAPVIEVKVPQQNLPDITIENTLQLDDGKIVVNVAAPVVAVKVDAPVTVTAEVKLPTVVETAVVEYEDDRPTKITKTYEQEAD